MTQNKTNWIFKHVLITIIYLQHHSKLPFLIDILLGMDFWTKLKSLKRVILLQILKMSSFQDTKKEIPVSNSDLNEVKLKLSHFTSNLFYTFEVTNLNSDLTNSVRRKGHQSKIIIKSFNTFLREMLLHKVKGLFPTNSKVKLQPARTLKQTFSCRSVGYKTEKFSR